MATRLSVLLAVLASLLGAAVGIPIGVLPALVGRRLGRLITSAINLAVAFPTLLLAIFVASIVGLGARGAVIGIAAAVAPYFARLSQTLAASVVGADYIAAARVLGIGRLRLTARHVLPNVAEPLLLTLMLTMGDALLALAGLSFLGVGVQPPSYDWGGMLTEGLRRIYVTPIVVVGPAVAIILAALGFNLLGETLAKRAARRDGTLPRKPEALPAVPVPEHRERVERAGRGRTGDGAGRPGPHRGVPRRLGSRARRLDHGRARRDRGHRRRVGVGQEPDRDGDRRAPAPQSAGDHRAAAALRARPLVRSAQAGRRRLLGRSLAIVYQDPMASLNPALRVGRQLGEVAEVHEGLSRREARRRSVERLRSVRIGSPERRVRNYPFELSGGMRQRVMIAMGLMGTPQLIIADEPTTALDVTVQQQILKLLDDVGTSTGAAAILISHDIAVVSQLCQRVLVMYAGRVVEELDVADAGAPTCPSLHSGAAGVGADDGVRPRAAARLDPRSGGRPVRPFARLPVRAALPCRFGRCGSELPVLDAAGERSPRRLLASERRHARARIRSGRRSPCGKTHSRDGARDTRPDRPVRARPVGAHGGRRRRPRGAGADDRRSRRRVRLGQVDACPGDRRARPDRRWGGACSTAPRRGRAHRTRLRA